MLKDYRVGPRQGGKPTHAVIFLHGVGDRGDGGLLGIGELWGGYLPDCAFLCPDAPFPFDMAPGDFGGRQWFSLKDQTPAAMLAGAKNAAPLLDEYIEHVLATLGLKPERLALVGFSQGTMMALYAGFRRSKSVACIIGYSGLMVGSETLIMEKKSAPPTLLVHGTADDVVPFQASMIAAQALKMADIPVKTLTCPGVGHTIDDAGIMEGLKFIKAAWGI